MRDFPEYPLPEFPTGTAVCGGEGYFNRVRSEIFPLVPPCGRLLDFGGGEGRTASRLKVLGRALEVGCVDASTDAAPGLDWHESMDLEDNEAVRDLLRRRGPVDCVLALDILEHLRDPWTTVRVLHENLAAGGWIVASVPNVREYRAVLPLVLKGEWRLKDAGILDRTHLRFFTRSSAVELMTSSGLRLEALRAAPAGGRKIKAFRMATFGLLNNFTDRQYLIKVRKAC